MWQAFQKKQSDRYVARICHVAKNTARKYRIKNKWDSRLKAIKQKVQEKSDKLSVKAMSNDMKIIEATIKVYAVSLMGIAKAKCLKCGAVVEIPVPKPKVKYRDIVSIIECHQKLLDVEGGERDTPKKVKYSLAPPKED